MAVETRRPVRAVRRGLAVPELQVWLEDLMELQARPVRRLLMTSHVREIFGKDLGARIAVKPAEIA
jgi:hypothetical protein